MIVSSLSARMSENRVIQKFIMNEPSVLFYFLVKNIVTSIKTQCCYSSGRRHFISIEKKRVKKYVYHTLYVYH